MLMLFAYFSKIPWKILSINIFLTKIFKTKATMRTHTYYLKTEVFFRIIYDGNKNICKEIFSAKEIIGTL